MHLLYLCHILIRCTHELTLTSDQVFTLRPLNITFEAYDETWLDFVSECRAGRIQGDWDIVRGGIADDKVFRTLDLYFAEYINKQEALRRLVYEIPNYQLCFRTQKAIDQCLTYLKTSKL